MERANRLIEATACVGTIAATAGALGVGLEHAAAVGLVGLARLAWRGSRRGTLLIIALGAFLAGGLRVHLERQWWLRQRMRHARSCACDIEMVYLGWGVHDWMEARGHDAPLPREYIELGVSCDMDDSVYCDQWKIPYAWVGDGLIPGELPGDALLAFCPTANPYSYTHTHKLTINGRMSRGCGDTSSLIEDLEKAIARGESGEIRYSPRAMLVLRHELAARRDWRSRAATLWREE